MGNEGVMYCFRHGEEVSHVKVWDDKCWRGGTNQCEVRARFPDDCDLPTEDYSCHCGSCTTLRVAAWMETKQYDERQAGDDGV